MKSSKYNVVIDLPEKRKLLYNAIYAGFAEVDDNTYELYKRCCSDGFNLEDATDEEKAVFENLVRGGMVITNDTIDEVAHMRMKYMDTRQSARSLSLTILPTLACNFNCSYCFEAEKSGIMSDEVMNKIVEYVETRVSNEKMLAFSIAWFGGEPLVAFGKIGELSEKFLQIKNKYDVAYHSEMVTNGWLLTDEICEKMKECSIAKLQITLDGPREIHDKKRVQKDGSPTFDGIIEKILLASKHMPVVVRVNLDRGNSLELDKLFEDIKPLSRKKNISIYPGKLSSHVTSSCSSIESSCLNVEEFAKIYKPFYSRAVAAGFPLSWYPNSKAGGCIATNRNGMTVCPDGSLCRCWSQVGNLEESYGNILGEKVQPFNGENYYKWMLHDPFSDKTCIECEFLPLCVGGCPAQRVPQTTDYMKGNNEFSHCTALKYNLKEMLLLVYENTKKRQEMEKAAKEKELATTAAQSN